MKIIAALSLCLYLMVYSTDATIIEPFRLFFLQYLRPPTTTAATSSTGSSGNNSSILSYNQEINLMNSTNTTDITITFSRSLPLVLDHDVSDLSRAADQEFSTVKECFNKHVVNYLAAVNEAKETVAECLTLRFQDIILITDQLQELFSQLSAAGDDEYNEINADEPTTTEMHDELRSVLIDAKTALANVRQDMGQCTQQMSNVIEQQNAESANLLDLCTANVEEEEEDDERSGEGTESDESSTSPSSVTPELGSGSGEKTDDASASDESASSSDGERSSEDAEKSSSAECIEPKSPVVVDEQKKPSESCDSSEESEEDSQSSDKRSESSDSSTSEESDCDSSVSHESNESYRSDEKKRTEH